MAAPELVVRVAANLDSLRKNLQEGGALIETTKSHLKQMSNAYDGAQTISRAGAVMQAIGGIQNITKLTAAEQLRANAILEAGLEKYRALGKEAPPGMQALADATRRVEQPLTNTNTTLDKIWGGLRTAAGLAGIAFSAGAVVNFAKSVFDTASQIDDMAQKLGISAEATQRFKYVAEMTGTNLDVVGVAITKMSRALVGGDDSAVAALGRAGLTIAELRGMRPEDAFLAIAEGIRGIPDPMMQAEVAVRLFGKSGAELLPAIREGIEGIGAGASVMANETVKRLAEAEDAWDKLWNKVTVVTGGWIAKSFSAYDQIKLLTDEQSTHYRRLVVTGGDAQGYLMGLASKRVESEKQVADATKTTTASVEDLLETLAEETRRKNEAEAAAKRLAEAKKELASAGIGWRGTLEGINEATVRAVKGDLEAGVAQGTLATVYDLTATQVKAVATALAEEAKAHKTAEDAAKKAFEIKTRALEAIAQAELDYTALVQANSLSRLNAELADNDAAVNAVIDGLKRRGVAEEEASAFGARVSAELTKRTMTDIDALQRHSRSALEDQARIAEATYRAALGSAGEYSSGAIEYFRLQAEEAQLAAAAWGTSFDAAGDRVLDKARTVYEGVRTYTEQLIASTMPLQQLSDADVNKMGGESALRKRLAEMEAYYKQHPGARSGGSGSTGIGSGDEAGYRRLLEMQVLYAQIKQYLDGLGRRASGGPVSAGVPVIVGERHPELFVPSQSGTILPSVGGGGGVTVKVVVNGSVLSNEQALAAAVGKAVTNSLRSAGVRLHGRS